MDNRGPSRIDLPRYLAALPLFDSADGDGLRRLAQGSSLRGYDRGQALFHVGERCEGFHLAVMGHVKLFVLSACGQEKVIEIAGPGQTFAESLMFTGAPHDVSAQALTGALVLTVRKDTVVAEIERDPRFSMRMLGLVSRRVHGLVRDVGDYTLCNGAQRLVGYLLRDVPDPSGCRGAVTVSLPVSKATVASRLSLTPEYFSRVLHDLEAQGLIEIERRQIRIPDASRLAAWAAEKRACQPH
jgi:CRP/FNR family transcriptional regulator, dissimilatory nitrate respiration regulator